MERQSARMKDQDPVDADDDGVHRSSSIIIAVDGGAPVLQSMQAQVYAFDSCSVRMRKRSNIFYTVTGLSLSNRLIVEYQFCANW
ncbi:hypothetical protein Hdeb2414_s0001g00037011 [Helianthus debilis subsp. tardiflorus]